MIYFHWCLITFYMDLHGKVVGKGAAEGASLRRHQRLPSMFDRAILSGSKTDSLLPKAAQQLGGRNKKNVRETNLQTLRSVTNEVEIMLQTPNSFPLSLWGRCCPQQPMEEPTLKQVGVLSLKEVAVRKGHMQEQELWPLGSPLWSSLVLEAQTLWMGPMCCWERTPC